MRLHLLALVLGLVTASNAQYRLPTTIRPLTYNLKINVPSDVFSGTTDEYVGEVDIQIQPQEDTRQILIHAAHDFIEITSSQIILMGEAVPVPLENITVDNVNDIATMDLGFDLYTTQSYGLTINFKSRLSTDDMFGFYRSSYTTSDGKVRYLATTQFQPTYARRAFPCFDEPSFKANFAISITHPSVLNALSNMPESPEVNSETGLTTTHFASTSLMSTYLVAFVVSDFTYNQASNTEGTSVPSRIWSTEETESIRSFSLKVSPSILHSLEEFTSFPYANMNFQKMDQIAIPDFAAGAMENWGLVTYREQLLLWDPLESTNRDQQTIATIIAHEFAHQWFGNLVTMDWWSEAFLNEGFATYFEYFTIHEIFPEWELDKQFVVRALQGVLASDSTESSQPLQFAADSDAQVMSRFSPISYIKGSCIFRMVEHIVGREHFRNGLRNYLYNNGYKNTLPKDLWTSLDDQLTGDGRDRLPAETTLAQVMENWVIKPGYPIINVRYVDNAVTIRQEGRFLMTGIDNTTKWYVPISYSTNEKNSFTGTAPQEWLTPLGSVDLPFLNPPEWIILNNHATGYYRVNYNNLWDNIATALRAPDFSGIPEVNRASLVDDAFELAKTSRISYSELFRIIEFLKNDTSHHAWYPALTGFDYLIRRIGLDSPLGLAMINHQLDLLGKIYSSVPWTNLNETDHAYTLKQVDVLSAACRLGLQDCVDNALASFAEYREKNIKPNKNMRDIVYCNALRNSNNAVDWTMLWDAYGTTELVSEKMRILQALGCTPQPDLLDQYLRFSISEDAGIRPQDAATVFTSVYSGSSAGVEAALVFLQLNYKRIEERYQSMNALQSLMLGLAERFTSQQQIDVFEFFITYGPLSEEVRVAADVAVQNAKANTQWLSQHLDELHQYYEREGLISTVSTETPSSPPNPGGVDITTGSTETPSNSPNPGDGAVTMTTSVILILLSLLVALRF